MINWCIGCQQFQGEVPPFRNYSFYYSRCGACSALPGHQCSTERLDELEELQLRLRASGYSGRTDLIERILRKAREANLRPVDILLGLITPLLYATGEEWERGEISNLQQEEFNTHCESALRRTEALLSPPATKLRVLLVNAPGNSHFLGIRILALYLHTLGMRAEAAWPTPTVSALKQRIDEEKIRTLGISLAMPEHLPGLNQLVASLRQDFSEAALKIWVGGFAVKEGLQIPGVTLVREVSELRTKILRPWPRDCTSVVSPHAL